MHKLLLNIRTMTMFVFALDKIVQIGKMAKGAWDTQERSKPSKFRAPNTSRERQMLAVLCIKMKEEGRWEAIPPAIQQWFLINGIENQHSEEFAGLHKETRE